MLETRKALERQSARDLVLKPNSRVKMLPKLTELPKQFMWCELTEKAAKGRGRSAAEAQRGFDFQPKDLSSTADPMMHRSEAPAFRRPLRR